MQQFADSNKTQNLHLISTKYQCSYSETSCLAGASEKITSYSKPHARKHKVVSYILKIINNEEECNSPNLIPCFCFLLPKQGQNYSQVLYVAKWLHILTRKILLNPRESWNTSAFFLHSLCSSTHTLQIRGECGAGFVHEIFTHTHTHTRERHCCFNCVIGVLM